MKPNIIILILIFHFSHSAFAQNVIQKTVITKSPDRTNAASRTEIKYVYPYNTPKKIESQVKNNGDGIIFSPNQKSKEENIEYNYRQSLSKSTISPPLNFDNSNNIISSTPYKVIYSFDANFGDNSIPPLDNCLAISDNDYIVSVTNASIYFYNKDTYLTRQSLNEFIEYSTSFPCDPKIIFDRSENKFIFFCMSHPSDNYPVIILGFSVSDNPLDGWHFYELNGNQLSKPRLWFDYPKIAISNDGLFISGNVYNEKNEFNESVLFQIEQNSGFKGEYLSYIMWYNFYNYPSTLVPMRSGYNDIYGPGIFLISTWLNNCDSLALFDLKSNINDPDNTIDYFKINTKNYFNFYKGLQGNDVNKDLINNGDTRLQDGFFCSDKLFFVFTSGNNIDSNSCINYNVLNISDLNNKSFLIGDDHNLSYAYPSICNLTEPPEKVMSIIQYNGASYKSFPDIRYTIVDDEGYYTNEEILKEGKSKFLGPNSDSWGDYSGICKKYNSSNNEVWMSSCYANKYGERQTLITCISTENKTKIKSKTLTSQNINFNLKDTADIKIVLKNSSKEIHVFEGKLGEGPNVLNIITEYFDKDNYKLEIINKKNNKILKTKDLNIK